MGQHPARTMRLDRRPAIVAPDPVPHAHMFDRRERVVVAKNKRALWKTVAGELARHRIVHEALGVAKHLDVQRVAGVPASVPPPLADRDDLAGVVLGTQVADDLLGVAADLDRPLPAISASKLHHPLNGVIGALVGLHRSNGLIVLLRVGGVAKHLTFQTTSWRGFSHENWAGRKVNAAS